MTARGIGIDGCRGGWLVAVLSDEGWTFALLEHMDELAIDDDSRVLIDMPIGLPDREARRCDGLARRQLGRRSSTIFPVPIRDAVYADDYRQACDINELHTGKRFSRQAWNLCPKIRQLDQWLRSHPTAPLYEAHPEIAFAHYNGGEPLSPKRSEEGKAARLTLLDRFEPRSREAMAACRRRYRKREVADDDILDAMILALAAKHALLNIPDEVPRDRYSLPMWIAGVKTNG